jgi:hypothetical protein
MQSKFAEIMARLRYVMACRKRGEDEKWGNGVVAG